MTTHDVRGEIAMELTAEQKQVVASWVGEGASLAEVQTRILSEFELSMTYMDVRFLVLDLNVPLQDPVPVVVAPPAEKTIPDEAPLPPAPAAMPPNEPPAAGGTVAVEVDAIMRPGSLVSGTVVFGDGTKATWMLDQMGRLALDAGDPNYKPSESDIAAFQTELQNELAKKGF
jgi:hypothetical protein